VIGKLTATININKSSTLLDRLTVVWPTSLCPSAVKFSSSLAAAQLSEGSNYAKRVSKGFGESWS
jgi:hypothetical protein